jgi:hypothetical protein
MSEKRAERLQIMLTVEEAVKLEDWRFEHRMPSRSAAIRALLNLGLRANSELVDQSALLGRAVSSPDIGVLAVAQR